MPSEILALAMARQATIHHSVRATAPTELPLTRISATISCVWFIATPEPISLPHLDNGAGEVEDYYVKGYLRDNRSCRSLAYAEAELI
jgi:hypothetical protein